MRYYISTLLIIVTLTALGCNTPTDEEETTYASDKSITSYSFLRSVQSTVLPIDVTGSISGTNISVSTVPNCVAVTSLIATFSLNAFYTTVSNAQQFSGTSSHDFSTNIIYKVFAEDTTSQDYTVSVSTQAYAETAPEAYNVSVAGTANEHLTLKGQYTFADVNCNTEGTSTYRWLRATTADGTYSAIGGATNRLYTVQAADVGNYLKFEVTPVATAGTTTGTAVQSAAFGPIQSGIPACALTINEWGDAGSNVDYLELKNLSSSSWVVTNSNTRITYGAGAGTTVTATNYLEKKVGAVASATAASAGVVLDPGEIILYVDSDVGDANITTIRGYNSFTGRIFIGSEGTTLGSNDRLDENQANLSDGTNTWSFTPTTTDWNNANVGTSTYSYLKSSFSCSSSATTTTSNWKNGSSSNRTAGTENPSS